MKLYAPDTEIRALKSICTNSDTDARILLLSQLTEDHFNTEPVIAAYTRMQNVLRKRGKHLSWEDILDDPTISEDYRDALRDSGDIKPVKSEERAQRILDTLEKYRKKRHLYTLAKSITEELKKDSVEIDELLDDCANTLNKARSSENLKRLVSTIGKDGDDIDEMLDEALSPDVEKLITTGLAEFDEKNGGFPSKGVAILAATTSGGKSVMKMNILTHMYLNEKISVADVSLEMDRAKSVRRHISKLTGIEFWKVYKRKLSKSERKQCKQTWREFAHYGKEHGCRYSYICPTGGVEIGQLLMTLKPYGHKVIAIDYIGLLDGVSDSDAQWKMMGHIVRECKIFSEANNCLIILLAQLDEKDDHIRYSAAMKEHADNCLTGDVLVSTPTGFRRLDSLVENKEYDIVYTNFKVVSMGKTRTATAWVCRGEKPVRKLISEHGFDVRGTDEHPIQVLTPDLNLEWKKLEDIKSGDYIAIETNHTWSKHNAKLENHIISPTVNISKGRTYTSWHPKDFNYTVNKSLAKILGYLVAEGYVSNSCVEFVAAYDEVVVDYVNAFKEVFGIEPNIKKHEKHTVVMSYRPWVCQFLMKIDGLTGGAKKKHIPSCIMESSKDVVVSFMQALFEGDGGCGTTKVCYYTTSTLLATQVHLLLLRFGIVSNKSRSLRKNPFTGGKALPLWTVLIGGYNNLTLFKDEIGFISSRKNLEPKTVKFTKATSYIPYAGEILRTRNTGTRNGIIRSASLSCLVKTSHSLSSDKLYDKDVMSKIKTHDPEVYKKLVAISKLGYYWDRVESVRKDGSEKVYDISVPSTESFTANGIVVHNCLIWNYSKQEQRDLRIIPIKQIKARDQELFPFDVVERFDIMSIENPKKEDSNSESSKDDSPLDSNLDFDSGVQ